MDLISGVACQDFASHEEVMRAFAASSGFPSTHGGNRLCLVGKSYWQGSC